MEQNDVVILMQKIVKELEQQNSVDIVFKVFLSVFFYWVSAKISSIENKISEIKISYKKENNHDG